MVVVVVVVVVCRQVREGKRLRGKGKVRGRR